MCGIAGYSGVQEHQVLKNMLAALKHRGPDDEGLFFDNDVAIGMTRLAIIDIEKGQQPMSNITEEVVIVFNGEIFNAPDIRKRLIKEGYVFNSHNSDTEVILNLYLHSGLTELDCLNGMFAFTIYDRRQHKLFIVRDRLGIKPLYYRQISQQFFFASEIKPLIQLPGFVKEVNQQSLYHYLSLLYIPGPDTIFSGIQSLLPGCYLEYDVVEHSLQYVRWWQLKWREDTSVIKPEDLCDEIDNQLKNAVTRWSLSDVSIACSLSGGLDSSGIASILSQQKIVTEAYSLGFTDKRDSECNELPMAGLVAKHCAIPQREIKITANDVLADLEMMIKVLEQPYGGGLPSWYVFKEAAKRHKVIHVGTGGDELFGNYGKWHALDSSWFQVKAANAIHYHSFTEHFFNRYYYCRDDDKASILLNTNQYRATSDFLWQHYLYSGAENVRDAIASVDIQTQLTDEFLMMTDRFSMAHGLEARTPLLDNAFMNFILSIPASIRTNKREYKYLLKRSLSRRLPRQVLTAPKKGFILPLHQWMVTQLKSALLALTNPNYLEQQGLFNTNFYTHCVLPCLKGEQRFVKVVWAVLMFQIWYELYMGAGSGILNRLELR